MSNPIENNFTQIGTGPAIDKIEIRKWLNPANKIPYVNHENKTILLQNDQYRSANGFIPPSFSFYPFGINNSNYGPEIDEDYKNKNDPRRFFNKNLSKNGRNLCFEACEKTNCIAVQTEVPENCYSRKSVVKKSDIKDIWKSQNFNLNGITFDNDDSQDTIITKGPCNKSSHSCTLFYNNIKNADDSYYFLNKENSNNTGQKYYQLELEPLPTPQNDIIPSQARVQWCSPRTTPSTKTTTYRQSDLSYLSQGPDTTCNEIPTKTIDDISIRQCENECDSISNCKAFEFDYINQQCNIFESIPNDPQTSENKICFILNETNPSCDCFNINCNDPSCCQCLPKFNDDGELIKSAPTNCDDPKCCLERSILTTESTKFKTPYYQIPINLSKLNEGGIKALCPSIDENGDCCGWCPSDSKYDVCMTSPNFKPDYCNNLKDQVFELKSCPETKKDLEGDFDGLPSPTFWQVDKVKSNCISPGILDRKNKECIDNFNNAPNQKIANEEITKCCTYLDMACQIGVVQPNCLTGNNSVIRGCYGDPPTLNVDEVIGGIGACSDPSIINPINRCVNEPSNKNCVSFPYSCDAGKLWIPKN